MQPKRIFLYLLIGSVAISAVVAIGVVLFGNFGNFEVRVMMTTLTVTVTSILGLACGAYLESRRGRTVPIAGIALSIAAALMTFLIIWNVYDRSETFIKATGSVTLLALCCSHLSLLSLARLDKRFAWSQMLAFVAVWLLATILLYLIWFEPAGESDLIFRMIGILSIVIAAVTVMTPVFHKLSAKENGVAAIDAEIEGMKSRIEELEREKAGMVQEPAAE
ncbi:MAG: hypothetical protein DMF62_13350 [Acidobacteria bacterium]|nr:MAG: hypothetical protein DMF62_13350 [Acidobacteriota bacterium]